MLGYFRSSLRDAEPAKQAGLAALLIEAVGVASPWRARRVRTAAYPEKAAACLRQAGKTAAHSKSLMFKIAAQPKMAVPLYAAAESSSSGWISSLPLVFLAIR